MPIETNALTGKPLVLPALLAFFTAMLIAIFAIFPANASAQENFTPTRFSVEVAGEGSNVIFIPGLSTSREVWRPNAAQIADSHRVHLIQIKGFGEPAGPNAEGVILAPLAEELAQYIAQEAPENPAIIGHSLGGLLALMLGAEYPDLAGRLMIVDTFPWYASAMIPPGAEVTLAQIEPQAAMLRDGVRATYGQTLPEEANDATLKNYIVDQSKLSVLRELTANADPRVVGQLVYDDLTTDMREDIAKITAPLTVLVPSNDAIGPLEQTEAFYRTEYAAAKGANIVMIAPAAHFLMLDQPEAFAAALADFLEG